MEPQPSQNLVKPWWNPRTTLSNHPSPRRTWSNPGGTLVEPYLKPPHPVDLPRHPVALAEPGGILVEPLWNFTSNHPAALAEPGGSLVEPSWNLTSNHPGPQPSQNLVERWWNPRGTIPQTTPDHPAALAELGGTLQPSLDPRWLNLTSNHPGPPRSPRRTWWNAGGTFVEPYLHLPQTPQPLEPVEPGGTFVQLSWNLRGTLVEPYLTAAPDHPRAYLG